MRQINIYKAYWHLGQWDRLQGRNALPPKLPSGSKRQLHGSGPRLNRVATEYLLLSRADKHVGWFSSVYWLLYESLGEHEMLHPIPVPSCACWRNSVKTICGRWSLQAFSGYPEIFPSMHRPKPFCLAYWAGEWVSLTGSGPCFNEWENWEIGKKAKRVILRILLARNWHGLLSHILRPSRTH